MKKKKMKQNVSSSKKNIVIKKVAMLSDEPFFWTTCAKRFFKIIINNYEWTTNLTTYKLKLDEISDKEILKGKLSTANYDVLLIPGGGVGDGHSITKGFKISPRVRKWKKKIQKFVKDGGSVIGFCGGTSLITPLKTDNRKPSSFCERQYNKSSIDITNTVSYYKYLAFPLFYPFQKKYPERIGTTAYVFSFKPTKTADGTIFHTGGVPIEINLLKNNPIFTDYTKDTLTVRWWGGQALITKNTLDRNVTICATYPKKELHEDKRTRIHAWRYTGGIIGLIRGFFKAMHFAKQERIKIFNAFMFTYYFAGNWKLSDKLIESDLANRPCIVTEEYPNANKARIILCTLHPEYMVWWDGHIEERKNNDYNCLAKGLYQWKDIKTLKKPVDDNLTHTWWVVRRFVAWASKIPDKDMPPIEKQKVKLEDLKQINRSLLWDGTMLNQMECI